MWSCIPARSATRISKEKPCSFKTYYHKCRAPRYSFVPGHLLWPCRLSVAALWTERRFLWLPAGKNCALRHRRTVDILRRMCYSSVNTNGITAMETHRKTTFVCRRSKTLRRPPCGQDYGRMRLWRSPVYPGTEGERRLARRISQVKGQSDKTLRRHFGIPICLPGRRARPQCPTPVYLRGAAASSAAPFF